MRLKLVLIVSLLAAIVGAGVPMIIVIATVGSVGQSLHRALSHQAHSWLQFLSLALPLVAALLGGIFVYRHTARRRKLQAALTVILILVLSFGAHVTALLLVH
jgi:hypothetical protein